jgi:hypothetical protein
VRNARLEEYSHLSSLCPRRERREGLCRPGPKPPDLAWSLRGRMRTSQKYSEGLRFLFGYRQDWEGEFPENLVSIGIHALSGGRNKKRERS